MTQRQPSPADGPDEPRAARAAPPANGSAERVPRPRPGADAPVVVVAGFWHRAVAALVDAAVVGPVALLCLFIAGKLTGIALPHAHRTGVDYWLDMALGGEPALWGGILLAAAVAALYLLLFQALTARTLGMRLLGLRLIDVYGEDPGLLRATVRTLGYGLCLATFSLGFVWIGFDREKRGLHDWVAGTYVVRARSLVR